LGITTGGVTSSLTAKTNLGFVYFDSIRNSSLHMDMNLDFSFVGFGVGGISLMATLFHFQLNM